MYEFYDIEAEKLSRRLQDVVDHNKIMKIMPRTLQGMCDSCYLLDSIGKAPDNAGGWLVYLCSFFKEDMPAKEMARFMFSLDFLNTACGTLEENEQKVHSDICKRIATRIKNLNLGKQGLFSDDATNSPLEETRQVLFSTNMLENMNQTAVKKLFQTIPNISAIADGIRNNMA